MRKRAERRRIGREDAQNAAPAGGLEGTVHGPYRMVRRRNAECEPKDQAHASNRVHPSWVRHSPRRRCARKRPYYIPAKRAGPLGGSFGLWLMHSASLNLRNIAIIAHVDH